MGVGSEDKAGVRVSVGVAVGVTVTVAVKVGILSDSVGKISISEAAFTLSVLDSW